MILEPDRWITHRRYGDYYSPGAADDIVQIAIAIGRWDSDFNGFTGMLGERVSSEFAFSTPEDCEGFQQLAIEKCYNPLLSAMHSMPITSMGLTLGDTLDKMKFDYSSENAFSKAWAVLQAWTIETDASLLFRLKAELQGIRDGYAETFFHDFIDAPVSALKCPPIALNRP